MKLIANMSPCCLFSLHALFRMNTYITMNYLPNLIIRSSLIVRLCYQPEFPYLQSLILNIDGQDKQADLLFRGRAVKLNPCHMSAPSIDKQEHSNIGKQST
ncbi:hypothetical protein HS088_TW22G00017 [Tripterygium wilfordii]|uniref:Uncharacterized protein n=1 Tax=Tripterygium wilfordii TaxID=458696 RepID=A0A7J7BWQ2_TRIWF|nr:hypothetical protein HS088_TW22G00017 [Tripterygium wilfordii]